MKAGIELAAFIHDDPNMTMKIIYHFFHSGKLEFLGWSFASRTTLYGSFSSFAKESASHT
jgi:hypothetical protein